VMGSRGSVIPFFLSQKKHGVLPITDHRMTRFMITLDRSVDLVLQAFRDMQGGEIFIPKIPSMRVCDIATAVAADAKQTLIGVRPGEKIHEQMIGEDDAPYTYEYSDYYKILPMIHNWSEDPARVGNGSRVAENFTYSSQTNSDWLSIDQLRSWIALNECIIGSI